MLAATDKNGEQVKRISKKPIGLGMTIPEKTKGTYRRYASQGKWVKVSNINMAFYLETIQLVSQDKAKKIEDKEKRDHEKRRIVSGFTIFKGEVIPNVNIYNSRTKETSVSDVNGKFQIHAKKHDVLFFTRQGYNKVSLTIGKERASNVLMQL